MKERVDLDKKREEVEALEKSGDLDKAEELLRSLLIEGLPVEDKVEVELEIALFLYRHRRSKEAIDISRGVIDCIHRNNLKTTETLAFSLLILGDALLDESNKASYDDEKASDALLQESEKYLTQAADIAPSDEVKNQAIFALCDLSCAKRSYDNAIALLETIKISDDNNRDRCQVLVKLGRIRTILGDYDMAVAAYEELLSYCDTLESVAADNIDLAHYYFFLSEAITHTERKDEAIDYLMEAISLLEPLDIWEAHNLLDSCYYSLGHYYKSRKDFQEAADSFQTAIRYCEKVGDNPGISLLMLGETYQWMSEFEKALKYYRRAEDYVSDPEMRKRLSNDVEACLRHLR